MTFQRPDQLPKWAELDQDEPISGQNNVNIPPDEIQNVGWLYKEFPPRQWFNWLGRYTYRWLAYLSQQEAQATVSADSGAGTTAFDFSTLPASGGIALVYVVDSAVATNFYEGIAFVPQSPSGARTINTVSNTNLTVTLTSAGLVTVAGGTGPYIVYGQLKTIP